MMCYYVYTSNKKKVPDDSETFMLKGLLSFLVFSFSDSVGSTHRC